IGPNPRWVGSTTPKRRRKYRDIVADPHVRVVRAHMDDNPHLTQRFRDRIARLYSGTALARQEVAGELIDDVEGALWKTAQLDRARLPPGTLLALARIRVAVDPPGGATEAGIVVAGVIAGICPCGNSDNLPHFAVIEDRSLLPSGPNHWGSVAINA